ncbi:MAG: hypothetical protein MPF33_06115 [Candidatus Aramenus sp.]|jgi:hypothetical protein|nr:hypothetical protein [Candidatus Aramenus sp.]
MEFLDKKSRLVLQLIAQGGPGGLTLSQLRTSLAYIVSEGTLSSILENLYFSNYINVLKDGQEVRYIANNEVRNAMIALELQKFKITKFLEGVKKKTEELSKQDKAIQLEELRKLTQEGLSVVAQGLFSLLKDRPELSVPEYVELVDLLNREFFSRTLPLLGSQTSQEELEKFLSLVSRYKGEVEAEVLKKALNALKGEQKP